MIKRIVGIIGVMALLINTLSCSAETYIQDQYKRIDFTAFDTICSIAIFEVEDYENYKIREEANIENMKGIIRELEKIFSRTDPSSELYRLNNRTTNEVMISRPLATIMDVAKSMYTWSVNYFDISVGNLTELWDIKNKKTPPSDAEVKEALSHANNMDYDIIFDDSPDDYLGDKIVFNGDPKTKYDLGALAKGYAAMNLKDVLENMGVKSAIINFGGSVTIVGSKGKAPFKIGVKRPFKEGYIVTEDVIERSLITSGTYERYYEYDGKIYSHIISNKTGYPIDNEITSVTINCANSLLGDYLSTAMILVGKENGEVLFNAIKKRFIEDDPDMSAIVIDKDENIYRYK